MASTAYRWQLASMLLLSGCLAGCGATATDGGNGSTTPEQVLSSNPNAAPNPEPNLEVEPNDDYATATPVFVGGPVDLIGAINANAATMDRDVWALGAFQAGDRITGQITIDQATDVAVGILDDQGRLLDQFDALSAASVRAIDFTLRSSGSQLYVAVATRSGVTSTANYTITLDIKRGGSVPPVAPQSIVLHFNGGSQVQVAGRTPVNVPAFDAAVIGSAFAGHTQEIEQLIVAKVRDDFGQLNVSLFTDNDATAPQQGVSHIYFGTYDAALLGLSDNVDPYNSDLTQTAIIYTDTFKLFNNLHPSIDQIAQALSNTTSHEIGHLLGLRHTANPQDLMDITAMASQMLRPQWFGTAAIHPTVLPLGNQDAPSLLTWAVGGTAPTPSTAKMLIQQRAVQVNPADDFYIPREYLLTCSCRECAMHAAHNDN